MQNYTLFCVAHRDSTSHLLTMDTYIKKYWLTVLFLMQGLLLFATHNRAGEITYVQTGPLTIRCTITTYTKSSSTAADRDSLVIIWGDGEAVAVPRSNGPGNKGVDIGNNIKYNLYIAEHTFPSRGTYTVSMQDPNRVGNIINIPNSINVPFYLETKVTLLDPKFQGFNNSAILLQPPIDIGCIHQPFIHNPNAYDPDGDSLAFELIPPFIAPGTPVEGYSYPDEILPGPNNHISLDPVTGTFVWDAPQLEGEYNIAILVKEYRQGVLINSLVRDMQIYITKCQDNLPPELSSVQDLCVIAGTVIDQTVRATDPNTPLQKIRLKASGSPFTQSVSPATFTAPSGFTDQPVIGHFNWQTSCDHISSRYYSIVFHATDSYFKPGQSGVRDTLGLSTLETMRIKVVGPPPTDVRADRQGDKVSISWSAPYPCDTAHRRFLGFNVWRSEHPIVVPLDTCSPGLDGYGYRVIKYNTMNKVADRYIYLDEDIEKGQTYCYRITAVFGKRTTSGTPYNIVHSLRSDEVCVNLSRDLPLITNVDIQKTSPNDGKVLIRWIKPLISDLDTAMHKGPYVFQLTKQLANGSFSAIPSARFVAPTLDAPIDTMYEDTPVATDAYPLTYKVDFYIAGNSAAPYGSTDEAASPFLLLHEGDHQIRLEVSEAIPWTNYHYDFMKWSASDMKWHIIGSSNTPVWKDEGLQNDSTYCYRVKTTGSYGLAGVPSPLINHSQKVCGSPHDTVPPCSPVITVNNLCTQPEIFEDSLLNRITWRFPAIECKDETGLTFRLYFAPDSSGKGELLVSFSNISGEWQIDHMRMKDLSGCYWMTAVDSLGNESPPSDKVCVHNCPNYLLPNTFTPNGDGQNDVFRPFPYRFVSKVKFKVFNQWGNLVFETTNPDLLWDGTNTKGKRLSDGVYFYTCDVYYSQQPEGDGKPNDQLQGFIHLINNQ